MIRKAKIEDINNILKIWYKNLDALYRPYKNTVALDILDNKYYVYELDNNIIGFCTYSVKTRKKEYRIEHLCIDDVYRRKGYGTSLLKFMLTLNTYNYPAYIDCVSGSWNNLFWKHFGIFTEERTLLSGLKLWKVKLNV